MGKAEQTRQLIIERTAQVFNTKGYAGTSLRDLTEVTGLTKGSIYGNFKNKDEVALEAFKYNVQQIEDHFRARMEGKYTVQERLGVYIGFYRKALNLEFYKAGCPVANMAPEVDDTHPGLRQAANQVLQLWCKAVARIVTRGQEKGEVTERVNPQRFARLFITQIEGAVLISKSTGDMAYLNDALDHLEDTIEAMLLTKAD